MSERILAGRYEIIEKIGEGGMAVVYKGRDRLLNRYVGIKVLRPEYAKDAAFADSFRRESQAAAGLSHPGIVNVYDVGKEGNVQYIVMELIEGKTLSEVIKENGPLDYKQAISIAKQIASALALAHKNNIIHRDVKPHNILITQDGAAKITDFGIARAVTDATIVGKSNVIMGSVHYFSPEQARGGYVDEKSDIYSLGIVLYEMLTGRVPYDADNPVTVAVMHMNEKLVPPSQLVSGIPPGLEQIVIKATEKYQINRFKTAEDMYEALDNVNFITGIIENPAVAELFRGNAAPEDEAAEEDLAEEEGKKRKMKTNNGKDGKKKDGKLSRIRVVAIVLALICAIPVSYFIYAGVQSIGAPKEVKVPKVQGLTEEAAQELLEDAGLKMSVEDRVNSFDYAEGEVTSQMPQEGTMVKEGYTVRVNISRGEPSSMTGDDEENEDNTVPNVVGKSLSEAETILDRAGYTRGRVTTEASELPRDYVIRQTPSAGEEVTAGTTVRLVVSDGSQTPEKETKQAAVPNLIGLNEAAAKKALQDIGLDIGEITGKNSSEYNRGIIMEQQHPRGTMLDEGTKVNVTISAGAAPNEPRSVPLNISYANAPSEVFTLTVFLVDQNGARKDIIHEAVRYKSAGSESITVTGQGSGTVYVHFSGVEDSSQTAVIDFSTGDVN